uniref:E3 ubiquitin-protein ligase rnf213-alpha n=1 Tax=Centroberyx gerrardi TaxID=166262 RepID=UPI003AB0D93F
MRGRQRAGGVMLRIIFDLLTTWNKPNVENFFFLLRQFFHTYGDPLLHDGMERPWGLPYGGEQVKSLLKDFLKEHIIPKPRKGSEKPEVFLPPLHAGVIALLVYKKYLRESITDQLSTLCDLLSLPTLPPHHFITCWENFTSPLPDQKSVADAVEMLCNCARRDNIEKWVLVIPLIHLLRGDSKPFEPVPPVLNPQFDSWTGHKGSKGTNVYRDHNAWSMINMMKENAHLADIDRLLVHSWMSLLSLDDLMSFISSVRVELLDILHHMLLHLKSGITYNNYAPMKDLAFHLIERQSHQKNSYDDKYGEFCLKTAVRLLSIICRYSTQPDRSEIPLLFLDLVCLIAGEYDCANSQ